MPGIVPRRNDMIATPEKFEEYKDTLNESIENPLIPPPDREPFAPAVVSTLSKHLEILDVARSIALDELSAQLKQLDKVLSRPHGPAAPEGYDGTAAEYAYAMGVQTCLFGLIARVRTLSNAEPEDLPAVLLGVEPPIDTVFDHVTSNEESGDDVD